MTTVIVIAILIVLFILGCTFGLLRKSKKKDRRDPFADVMTTLSTMPSGPLDPSSIIAAGGQLPPGMIQGSNMPYNPYLMQGQQQFIQSPNQNITGQMTGQTSRGSYPQVYSPAPSSYPIPGDVRMLGKYASSPYGPPAPPPPTAMGFPPQANQWLAPGVGREVTGSAEAEFLNDFIEVFPMQHLEPKPDLN